VKSLFFPRIAVTVDMIATGTDVKPLECLVFLRNIKSLSYFEQMKGRGCRVVDSDTLQSVTPDAKHKTHFVIVDAIGVCEEEKSATKPLDCKPTVSLEKLLNLVAAGYADAEIVSTLASRLARLERQVDPEQEAAIAEEAGGKSLPTLSGELLESIEPDAIVRQAVEQFSIPDGEEPTEEQLAEVELKRMQEALKPFHNPKLREVVLGTKRALEQVIDEQTPDTLLVAGFDAAAREKAQSLVVSFRQFIEEHKDEIEALKILYSQPYRMGLRYSQVKALAKAIQQPPFSFHPERLWHAFETIEPEKVKGHGGKQLVDLVALVRHAIDPTTLLVPLGLTVEERYQQWLADQSAAGAKFTVEQRRWLDAIKDHIATSLAIDRDDLDEIPFNQIGGLGRAYELFGERLSAILDEMNQRLAV
jgi:type I restriction enzyme R subunit